MGGRLLECTGPTNRRLFTSTSGPDSRVGPCRAGYSEHLCPRNLGLLSDALSVASRILCAIPPGLGLDAGLLPLDAGGGWIPRWILGFSFCQPRAALCPGVHQPPLLDSAAMVLSSQLRGVGHIPSRVAFRPTGSLPLLFRGLL